MQAPLEAVKERIKTRYLGRGGIHAVGMRRGQNMICVYVSSSGNSEREQLLKEIREVVAPFKLLVVTEEPPSLK
jgi:hypothetical protein